LALSRHYFFAKVRFAPTDYRAKRRERRKIMTLAVDEFIRRFLIHVLPNGFHRIRHCGLSPTARAPITSQVRVSCSPRMAFGIGRLCPVPTGPLAFAVLGFDCGFRCLGHGEPFLQLSEVADDG
jgi:hypothetical protein